MFTETAVVATVVATGIVCLIGLVTFLVVKKSPYTESSANSTTNQFSPVQKNTRKGSARKITYEDNDEIRLAHTDCKLYRGLFENNIKIVVKKIKVLPEKKDDIITDLNSLKERLKRVVDINHNLAHGNSGLNIVKFFCYDFEVEYEKTFLLLGLEMCECNLEEFIRSRHSYPPVSNSAIMMQLLSGLQYLHDRQIVHRDLKPSNVLIKRELRNEIIFKLSDFGLSKLNTEINNGTPAERVFQSDDYGTIGWIPPEIFVQREGSVPNPERSYWKRSDIFPLGLLFYYVATDGHYVFSNQEEIQNGNWSFIHISGNDPLLRMLKTMLAPKHEDRPYTEDVSKHPAFWDIPKQLEFFVTTSNVLNDPYVLPSCNIEQNAVNVLRGNWKHPLTINVKNYIFPAVRNRRSSSTPIYNQTSVKSLIRAIRNNKGHFHELQSAVRSEFGNSIDGFLKYWTDKFPQLLMHTYDAMKVHISTHSDLKKFY